MIGPDALSVTSHLDIDFLRKPAPADVIGACTTVAQARPTPRGRRRAHVLRRRRHALRPSVRHLRDPVVAHGLTGYVARQNSLPSGSASTTQGSTVPSSSDTRTPSATRRAVSASMSSQRRSRCTRFLTVFDSGFELKAESRSGARVLRPARSDRLRCRRCPCSPQTLDLRRRRTARCRTRRALRPRTGPRPRDDRQSNVCRASEPCPKSARRPETVSPRGYPRTMQDLGELSQHRRRADRYARIPTRSRSCGAAYPARGTRARARPLAGARRDPAGRRRRERGRRARSVPSVLRTRSRSHQAFARRGAGSRASVRFSSRPKTITCARVSPTRSRSRRWRPVSRGDRPLRPAR